ncbi:UNVERIFIED_CONTAM: hypothetical protein Sradi_5288700 [Sesamum radiatum]|uniref:Uncharacterized protein n=1 Tax=Sesamum radiatum TaxID=300843 RepID=A0AAW2LNC7_SESRA
MFEEASGFKLNMDKSAIVLSKNTILHLMIASRLRGNDQIDLQAIPKYAMSCFKFPEAWRITIDTGNLVHQLLKARCFPACSFVDAAGRRNISYAWRSILAARPLLQAAIRWFVGDGKCVHLSVSLWLPRPSAFRLMAPPRTLRKDALVEVLFNPAGSLDEECIGHEFDLMDAEWILCTPINEREIDTLYWYYNSKGRFSVKSAYSLALH